MYPAYSKTRFHLSSAADALPESFWIITAGNPSGVTISASENGLRTEKFRVQLVDHGLPHFPISGFDPDSPQHSEAGFGVVCDATTAIGFGRQWEQEAIFKVEHGEVTLVSCADPSETWALGSWLSRAGGI